MVGELVKAVATFTAGVLVMPGGILDKVAEHLSAPPAVAALTAREEAAGEMMPRVVFAPTREEAEEATSELVAAIEMIHPSDDSDGNGRSIITEQESASSPSNSLQAGPAVARVSGETTIQHVVSPMVLMAFRLLRQHAVQIVVSSLARDPNVVEAVVNNPQLGVFLRRWRPTRDLVTSAEGLIDMPPVNRIEYSSNDAGSMPSLIFDDLLKIVQGMADLMKSLSDFVKNLFGGEGARFPEIGGDDDHGANAETVMELLLLGLAIMVIMLISLKRG